MAIPAQPLSRDLRAALETALFPAWLPRRRWWRSKSRALECVAVEAAFPLARDAVFCIVRATFAQGDAEYYAVPLAFVAAERTAGLPADAVLGTAPDGHRVSDACHDPAFRDALLRLMAEETGIHGEGGLLRGRPDSRDLRGLSGGPDGAAPRPSRLHSGEQSNTSFAWDGRVAVKLYRRFEAGIHPEPEMLRFLRHAGYRGAPAFLASLEWVPADGSAPRTLALAQEFVRDARDAWEYVTDVLREAPDDVPETLARLAATLGARTGELHAALASRRDDSVFAPEPLLDADLAAARAGSMKRLDAAEGLLGAEDARKLRDRLRAAPVGPKIRVHGDLHLGQILLGGGDPFILDFEGEPGRPLAEARRKASPLRDAAGMLRSFHYAAHAAARDAGRGQGDARADARADALARPFLEAYFGAVPDLFPPGASHPEAESLLNFFILEKALYELEYERNNRPDWIDIPLRGLRRIAG